MDGRHQAASDHKNIAIAHRVGEMNIIVANKMALTKSKKFLQENQGKNCPDLIPKISGTGNLDTHTHPILSLFHIFIYIYMYRD